MDPERAIGRPVNREAPAIGFVPIVAVEHIEGNPPPLQNGERRSADLSGVHHNSRTPFHLADITQLNTFREPGQHQWSRVHTAEVPGAYSRNDEKETHSGEDDPDRGPH